MKRDALTLTLLRAVLWSAIAGSILLPSSALSACNPGTLFDPAWFYQTANYAFCPVSADLNGDGITDIAVTCYFSNGVSLLFGMGDGSFTGPTNIPVGATARNLVAADVNGDGILDLVVTNVTPSTVTVLIGLGTNGHNNGQFAQPVAYAAGQENRGLAVTDLNGDGHPDLVVGGLTSVAILLNQNPGSGWGTFGPPALYPQPWCWPVAVGDFNGDGLTDVAAGNWLTPELDILLGNGNGTFTAGAKITVPGGCSDIAVKDLDGDGILDLAVSGVGGIWVMRGNGTGGHGDGTFTLTPYAQLGHTFNGILVADFNGDENDDIVGTDTDGIQVLLLPGRGDGTFGEMDTYPVGTGPIMMTAFDANRDGLLDLMVACSASLGLPGAMAVMLGRCVAGPEPVLTAVRDVKNDQGGKVFVTWRRSALDTKVLHGITNYRVWRRAMPALAEASLARDLASFDPARHQLLALRTSRPNGLQDVDYWEPLATIPAAFLDGYAYTASTSQDSLPGSNPYTAFFIQALTSDFTVFYSSQVDSGYSVDNLAPASPAPFVAVYSASGVALHWSPNREADLYGYRLHRGTRSDFVPGPGNLVASLSDTGYVDHPPGCAATYKLCALDIHGNASLYALVSVTGPTAVLASLVSADVEDGVVRLRWSAPANPGLAATVYRDEGDGRWQFLCTIVADGTGLMRYDDASVTPGARYGYRLGILNGDQEVYVGEVLVTVPVLALALRGVRPNPALNDLTVAFSLPDASPARIEVLDLAGRRVLVREVGTLGAGHHTLNLTNSQRLPAGIYLIRLASGGRSLVARATVVR